MRKVLVFLVVAVLLLAIGADFLAKSLAERAVANELTSELELEETPDVSIDSFPFLVAFSRGRLHSMTITSNDVAAGRLNLAEVVLTLNDTTFDTGDVISGDVDQISISGGEGEAALAEADLNEALMDEDVQTRARLSPGTATIETDAGSVEGQLDIDEDGLTVAGPGGISILLRLPSLGGRVTFDDLEIKDGEATLFMDVAPGPLRRPD